MTGPFWPFAPWWMCAIVPSTPVVLTLPSTAPSELTRMVPSPVPEVWTGGTSSAPESFTLTAPLPASKLGAYSWYVEQDASAAAAATSNSFLIELPPGLVVAAVEHSDPH